jgi:hypothetical protein
LPDGPGSFHAGVDPKNNTNRFAASSSDGRVYAARFDAAGNPAGPLAPDATGEAKEGVPTQTDARPGRADGPGTTPYGS